MEKVINSQVKETISRLYKYLKKRHLFGFFMRSFEPLKETASRISSYNLDAIDYRLYTNKVIFYTPSSGNQIFYDIKFINELLKNRVDIIQNILYKQDVFDIFLEDYFKENKDKYKTTKTNVYYSLVIGAITVIIWLALLILLLTSVLGYGVILAMLLSIWFLIIYAQCKLCVV